MQIEVNRIEASRFVDEARPINRFKLVFRTPTYLKQSDSVVVLFPQPDILCKHLARVWNELLPKFEPLDADALAAWSAKHVRLTSYSLETAPVSLDQDRRATTGFHGWASFATTLAPSIEHDDLIYATIVDRLLQFAIFSGIGGNRTTGMGSIKVHDVSYYHGVPGSPEIVADSI